MSRIPDNEQEWASFTEEMLVMRKCAYWKRLVGEPTSQTQKRIEISRKNIFDDNAIKNIFKKINDGDEI